MHDLLVKWIITLTICFGVPLGVVFACMPFVDISHATYLAEQGAYEPALRAINRAIAFNSGIGSLYTRRGWLYDKLEIYDRALADFNHAIAIADFDWEPFNNRAWLFTHLPGADLKQALPDANRAISLCAQCATAYDTRGYIEMRVDQMPKALLDFNQALALNRKLGEAYWHRGQYYAKSGDLGQAEADRVRAHQYGFFE